MRNHPSPGVGGGGWGGGGGDLALLLTQSALMEQISIYLCTPALAIVSSCLHILAIMCASH